MIKRLLEDYLAPMGAERVSAYEQLKTLRGQLKEISFHQTRSLSELHVPRELSFLKFPISQLREKNTRNIFRVSLLIQTRACGTPPPTVFMKTARKFRETVCTPSEPPTRGVQAKIAFATRVVYERIASFTRVDKQPFLTIVREALEKAKISLSESAELDTSREEGGKYEAFRQLCQKFRGTDVYEVDLENGQLTDRLIPDDLDHIGTRAFHYSFNEAIHGRITDLMTVRCAGVLEPGKVREITVADIHHAVLLHPISHILLDVLKEIPSSSSGIKAASHAFEFYKRLSHKNPNGNFIFDEKDLWILSSDLETATDYANPHIVRIILQVFLGPHCLGVPKLYRILISRLLTEPRQVVDTYSNEEYMTTRGCLMGDPVTKFVMHMLHLVGKEISLALCK